MVLLTLDFWQADDAAFGFKPSPPSLIVHHHKCFKAEDSAAPMEKIYRFLSFSYFLTPLTPISQVIFWVIMLFDIYAFLTYS